MAVVNVPPDGLIYTLGRINGNVHVYNTNNPPAAHTIYSITIVSVNAWLDVSIDPGHTNTYPAGGNAVYIQNMGLSRLQVLYLDGDIVLTPKQAGWKTVDQTP